MSRLSLVAKYFLFNLNILILSNVLLILKNYVSRYFAAVRTVKYFVQICIFYIRENFVVHI